MIEAKVFNSANGTGVAVLTSSYRFFLVNSVKDPKTRSMPEIPGMISGLRSLTVVCIFNTGKLEKLTSFLF